MEKISIGSLIELIKHLNLDVNPDKLDPEKDLAGQGLDSLDLANFLFGIDDKFSVNINDDINSTEYTLKGLVKEINEYRSWNS